MREKILDKYGLSDDAKGNVLCLTSLVLKLDERIEALTSANNELIKTLSDIKDYQEEILGKFECKFSEAWVLASEVLGDD